MSEKPDADVIVVGGGAAGLACALALAQGGHAVIVLDGQTVERRADPDFDGRAYAVAAASRRCLQALGVWDRVSSRAQPFAAIEIFDGRLGDPGPVRLRFDGDAIEDAPFAALIEDRFLRGALLDAVAAEPRIDHRSPVTVAGMTAKGARARLALADGGSLTAGLVVAADGRRSPLAASTGTRWTGARYDQMGLVCAVNTDRPHQGVARQIFYPAGPFAMLPLPGDRVSLVWSERTAEAQRIAALPDDAYMNEVRLRAGGLLGEVSLAGRRWAYPLMLALAYDYTGPRLALLGDAAHAVHPIAGQGLNMGLRDVAALAQVLTDARRRGEDIGDAAVLARYQEWRRFDAAAMGGVTDGLNRLFSTDLAPLRLLRDAGLRLVDAAPPLKRAFVAAAAGRSGDVPRLMQGKAL